VDAVDGLPAREEVYRRAVAAGRVVRRGGCTSRPTSPTRSRCAPRSRPPRSWARHGIRVNTIAPGLIDTPIYGSGEQAEAFKAKLGESVVYPNRLGRAEEFASLAVEVLTNDYMNGETIRRDGAIRMPPR
jgi:hypothetical protein